MRPRRTRQIVATVSVVGFLVLLAPLAAAAPHRFFDRHDSLFDSRDFRHHRSLLDDRHFGRSSILDDRFYGRGYLFDNSFYGYRSSRVGDLLVLNALAGNNPDALLCAYGRSYSARVACAAAVANNCVDPLTASLLLDRGRFRERDLVLLLAASNRNC